MLHIGYKILTSILNIALNKRIGSIWNPDQVSFVTGDKSWEESLHIMILTNQSKLYCQQDA